MESRYVTDEFRDFWTLENKYRLWLEVEFNAHQVMVESSVIPNDNYDFLNKYYDALLETINVDDILKIEERTHHDVVAFLEWLETITNGKTKFFHHGLTSSDLVDTALSIQIIRALAIIDKQISVLINELQARASDNVETIMMGRTHGKYAQPTTLSNFFLGHMREVIRARKSISQAINTIRFGKMSGPVGAYSNISPETERLILERLNLEPEPVATQVIPRDRHLDVIYSIAKCSVALERLALNIRHLNRSEVDEISEGFKPGQKGSSAMAHKKNPISCEKICGLSRYIRSMVAPAFEDCLLWNDRDISHSSVERLIIPEATTYLSHMIKTMTGVIRDLNINSHKMNQRVIYNITKISESLLLYFVQNGMDRSKAHDLVQKIMDSQEPLHKIQSEKLVPPDELFAMISSNSVLENSKKTLERTKTD